MSNTPRPINTYPGRVPRSFLEYPFFWHSSHDVFPIIFMRCDPATTRDGDVTSTQTWLRMIKSVRDNLYLLFNAIFLSGIILIGTRVLLFVSWITAIWFAIATFIFYLCVVYGAFKLVTSRTVGSFLKERYKETSLAFSKAAIIASIVAFATIPYALLLDIIGTGTPSSPKYYFYATACCLLAFVTTVLHFSGIENKPQEGLEALKAAHTLQLELLKTLLGAFALVIFGTAYAQILGHVSISTGEMILTFYTFVGAIGFVLLPVAQGWFETLDRIREYERKSNAHA
jgi:hypothetical protein